MSNFIQAIRKQVIGARWAEIDFAAPMGSSRSRFQSVARVLLFRSIAGRGEKGSDLNIGDLATRGKIGLVPDEHSATVGIKGEQPPIPVGTAANLSGPNATLNLLDAPP